jgi:hypothetical protein
VDALSCPYCPYCSSGSVERIGQWGGQIITSQWRCRGCGSYFEALREDFDDQADPAGGGAGAVHAASPGSSSEGKAGAVHAASPSSSIERK